MSLLNTAVYDSVLLLVIFHMFTSYFPNQKRRFRESQSLRESLNLSSISPPDTVSVSHTAYPTKCLEHQKQKLYQEKLYTFMISITISLLNTPQSLSSLPDIFPNFHHKSITAYWTFPPDNQSLISKTQTSNLLQQKCSFS